MTSGIIMTKMFYDYLRHEPVISAVVWRYRIYIHVCSRILTVCKYSYHFTFKIGQCLLSITQVNGVNKIIDNLISKLFPSILSIFSFWVMSGFKKLLIPIQALPALWQTLGTKNVYKFGPINDSDTG